MSGPTVSALICLVLFGSEDKLKVLGLYGGFNRWLFYSWIIAQGVCWGSVVISWMFPGHGPRGLLEGIKVLEEEVKDYSRKKDDDGDDDVDVVDEDGSDNESDERCSSWKILFQGTVVGALMNVPLMLTEELGWRGYLWDHLKDKLGFWSTNIVIGFLWGIWHVPVVATGYNYPGMPVLGPILFTFYCMLLAPLFGFVRLKNDSVWGPCVLHGALNALAALTVAMVKNHGNLFRGVVGVGGFGALLFANCLLWLYV